MNALSPDQTHQHLNEAAERQQLSRIDATVGAVFSGGIAVLVAATDLDDHLAREPVGFAISMGVHAWLWRPSGCCADDDSAELPPPPSSG